MLSGARDPQWETAGFQQGVIGLIRKCCNIDIPLDSVRVDAEDSGTMAGMLAGRIEPDPHHPPRFVVRAPRVSDGGLILARLKEKLANDDIEIKVENDDILVVGTFANLRKALIKYEEH